MQIRDHPRTHCKKPHQHGVKFPLRLIRRLTNKAPFPSGADQHRHAQPHPVSPPQRIPRNQKIKIRRHRQQRIHSQREIQYRRVRRHQHQALYHAAPQHLARLGILEVQVEKQRRQEAQPGAQNSLGKNSQQRRRLGIVNLRIQRQQRSSIEEKQRQAQKEKHPLEVSLPPVAEYHYHPKQLEQRPSRVSNQPNVDERTHKPSAKRILRRRRKHYNLQVSYFSCTT